MRSGVAHLIKSLEAEVADVVASEVVALVVLLTTNGASALRFIASIVALGATVSTLMLTSYTETDVSELAQRPYVGHGIAVTSFGIGLCAILVFVAAWADRWTEVSTRSGFSDSN